MQVEATDLSSHDIEQLRRDTPGVEHVVHFNHAGASLMPQAVIDTTVGHIQREGEIGGYEAADEAADRQEAVYGSIAKMLGATPSEIAIIENATRAWDMAFYAIAFAPGDRILTSVAEYASNVIAFLQMRDRGVSVEVVPNDEAGQMSIAALEAMLDERVKVVAVSHMPTNGGLVQPAAAIGSLAKDAGAIYLLDACQTVGQMPVDVGEIQCDILSATSRKYLRGPRGAGFLYVRESLIESLAPPMLDLRAATWTAADSYTIRDDARRFENWERSVASVLGMGVAIDLALGIGLGRIWSAIERQAARLRERLGALPGVTVHDLGEVKGGIVTFDVAGQPAPDIVEALRADRINTVVSRITSTRYDMEARGLAELVRASVHYLTTDEEIDALCGAVERLSLKGD